MKNITKLNQAGFDHVLAIVVFVVIFALAGIFLLIQSHAASWSGALQLGYDKGLCLNDNNSSKANGTTIGIYTCQNAVSEKWTIAKYSNGQFQLKNGQGICADDWGAGVSTSTTKVYLKTYACQTNNGSEFWIWNGHELENAYSKGCINDPAYSKTNSTGLIIWPCAGSYGNEQWFEAALGSSGGTSTGGGSNTAGECTQEGGNSEDGGCYFWGQGVQSGITATGAQVTLSATAPKVSSQDYHSDSEMLVSNSAEKDSVEVCSIVGPGSSTPHLLIDYWNNGAIYDNDFVAVSGAPIKNGGTMPTTGTYVITIKYVNAQWQVDYNNKEVGYYPESTWGSNVFTQTQFVDVYGEVEGYQDKETTSQMGNGLLGTNANSAYFSNYSLIGSSTAPNLTVAGPSGAAAKVYNVGYITPTGFHYGGPGF